jgi:hypothetical protein
VQRRNLASRLACASTSRPHHGHARQYGPRASAPLRRSRLPGHLRRSLRPSHRPVQADHWHQPFIALVDLRSCARGRTPRRAALVSRPRRIRSQQRIQDVLPYRLQYAEWQPHQSPKAATDYLQCMVDSAGCGSGRTFLAQDRVRRCGGYRLSYGLPLQCATYTSCGNRHHHFFIMTVSRFGKRRTRARWRT